MGAESGSQKILSAMDKGTRVDQIAVARENLRAEGIRACYFLQFGYPGENWQDIQKTIALVNETRPDDIGVSVSYPLPGTRFFDRVQAQLGKKTNWSDSEDLSMMFQGTYTSEFYRAIRDLIHDQIVLQTVEKDVPAGQNSAAKRALERRWHDLLSRESLHRSQLGSTATARTG